MADDELQSKDPGQTSSPFVDFAQWLAGAGADAPTAEFSDHVSDVKQPNDAPAAFEDVSNLKQVARYKVKRQLGAGGFGTVFLALDTVMQREVALKVISAAKFGRDGAQATYLHEAQCLAKLDHSGIVRVFDCGEDDSLGLYYVVSELIEGSDLAAVAHELSWQDAVEICARVADALHYVHRMGLVHRDVKPANILMDSDGQPRLADFGAAITDREVTVRRAMAGTYRYMSPEQAEFQASAVDGRSDIFSLGAVLYQLLTGRPPFLADDVDELLRQIRFLEPKPLRQIADHVPVEVERVCLKALAKQPEDRYTTARDFASALRASNPKSLPSYRAWPRRAALVGISAISLAGIGIILSLWFHNTQQKGLVNVLHYDRSGRRAELKGPVNPAAAIPFDDALLIDAQFVEPLYVIVLILAANGDVHLEASRDEAGRLTATTHYSYPASPPDMTETHKNLYLLNDGQGLHSIIVVGLEEPPLDLNELRQFAASKWQTIDTPVNWVYRDGKIVAAVEHKRGPASVEVEPHSPPKPLQEICAAAAKLHGESADNSNAPAYLFAIALRVHGA